MHKTKKDWLLAFLLTLPMIFFYAGHFLNHSSSLISTGFIAYDNVSYVAYGKEYLDQDNFHLLYSNPLNDSGDYAKIYFQTQNIFFAMLLACGISPGIVLVLFNWLGTLLSFRMAIAIYDHLVPDQRNRKLFISFFCWGGGLLALAGVPIALTRSMGNLDLFDRIFYVDPAWGWWGLNFGRGHFTSAEGYFHFLFLASILCILKKKWIAALAIAATLSLSHPFTGLEFLAIVATWAAVEKIFARNKNIPWGFFFGIVLIFAFHTLYYLYYLNQFPEHRSVSEQYSLNWRLRFFNMVPAWCIVGTLAIFSFLSRKKDFFKDANARLFLCWFIVAFTLANHEMFMKPMQPIHFTRGYIWTSLFLLGLPALRNFFQWSLSKGYRTLLIGFSILFLSDNFLWIVNYVRFTSQSASVGHITHEQKHLLDILNTHSTNKTLIIGKDNILPYLSTVYTKAYPWLSHPYTTPFVGYKEEAYSRFLLENKIDTAWENRPLIFIFRKSVSEELARAQSMPFAVDTLANTESYIIQSRGISKN